MFCLLPFRYSLLLSSYFLELHGIIYFSLFAVQVPFLLLFTEISYPVMYSIAFMQYVHTYDAFLSHFVCFSSGHHLMLYYQIRSLLSSHCWNLNGQLRYLRLTWPGIQILVLSLFQALDFLSRFCSIVISQIYYWRNTQLFSGGYIGNR